MTLTPEQAALLPTDDEVRAYRERGFYLSRPLFTDEEVDAARRGSERFYARDLDEPPFPMPDRWRPTGEYGAGLRKHDYASFFSQGLSALVRHPLLAAVADRLAGTPQVRLWHDQLLFKPTENFDTKANVGWHTDRGYWKTCSSPNMLTAWIPFHDCDEQQGTITMIDGSLHWPDNTQTLNFFSSDLEGPGEEVRHGRPAGRQGADEHDKRPGQLPPLPDDPRQRPQPEVGPAPRDRGPLAGHAESLAGVPFPRRPPGPPRQRRPVPQAGRRPRLRRPGHLPDALPVRPANAERTFPMTHQPTITLTPEQVAFYHENGFLSIPAITTPEEVARLRGVYDRLFEQRAGRAEGNQFDLAGTDEEGRPAALPQILGPRQYAPELADTLYEVNARAIATQLLGEGITFTGDHAIFKPAGVGAPTPWHQDEAYWDPNLNYHSLSVWMPLQEATIGERLHGLPARQPQIGDHDASEHRRGHARPRTWR